MTNKIIIMKHEEYEKVVATIIWCYNDLTTKRQKQYDLRRNFVTP